MHAHKDKRLAVFHTLQTLLAALVCKNIFAYTVSSKKKNWRQVRPGNEAKKASNRKLSIIVIPLGISHAII